MREMGDNFPDEVGVLLVVEVEDVEEDGEDVGVVDEVLGDLFGDYFGYLLDLFGVLTDDLLVEENFGYCLFVLPVPLHHDVPNQPLLMIGKHHLEYLQRSFVQTVLYFHFLPFSPQQILIPLYHPCLFIDKLQLLDCHILPFRILPPCHQLDLPLFLRRVEFRGDLFPQSPQGGGGRDLHGELFGREGVLAVVDDVEGVLLDDGFVGGDDVDFVNVFDEFGEHVKAALDLGGFFGGVVGCGVGGDGFVA